VQVMDMHTRNEKMNAWQSKLDMQCIYKFDTAAVSLLRFAMSANTIFVTVM
jgi:hypothetical protein